MCYVIIIILIIIILNYYNIDGIPYCNSSKLSYLYCRLVMWSIKKMYLYFC